jgi:5-methylthioadenosine/S-adenosylhomocysteine deaminase
LLDAVADLSRRYQLPVHMHVLETRTQAVAAQRLYGKTMIEVLADHELLSPRMTINHAIWVTEADVALMGEARCSATHNPLSNLKLGSGLAPVRQLAQAGVNVALGTDGASTGDTFDLVEALRTASLVHNLGSPDPAYWVSAMDALRMSTINGARCNLRQNEIGSLEVGKMADVILLDKRHPGFIPLNDPVRQLAYSVTSEAVDTVIVGGRTLLYGRKFVALNEDSLLAEIAEVAESYRRDVRRTLNADAAPLLPALHAMLRKTSAVPIPATANYRLAKTYPTGPGHQDLGSQKTRSDERI